MFLSYCVYTCSLCFYGRKACENSITAGMGLQK